jgi:hypothetical protein
MHIIFKYNSKCQYIQSPAGTCYDISSPWLELFADSAQNRCEKGEQELLVQLPRKTSGVIVLAGTGVTKFVVILQQLLAAHTSTLRKLWKGDEFFR